MKSTYINKIVLSNQTGLSKQTTIELNYASKTKYFNVFVGLSKNH